MPEAVRVDVWSDLVCPWCYIGRARIQRVAAEAGIAIDLRHHAYELDPSGRASEPTVDALRRKYGPNAPQMMQQAEAVAHAEGLPADLMASRSANTRRAHALVAWAAAQDEAAGERLVETLMRAHFAHGADLGDDATLVRAAAEAGLDAAAASQALRAGAGAEQVDEDIDTARALGVRGVPFFVLGGRIGLSGAQPAATFAEALRRAQALQATPAPPG